MFEVGQIVTLRKEKPVRIVAVDSSKPHPAPGLIEWKYIVKDESGLEERIQDETLLSPIEEVQ